VIALQNIFDMIWMINKYSWPDEQSEANNITIFSMQFRQKLQWTAAKSKGTF
jgi:hypothetical protein